MVQDPKASGSLDTLQCLADLGQPGAQTELARRYEFGVGVLQNHRRAAQLYARAAATAPEYTAVYAPPVRLDGRGQVLFLPSAGSRSGDPEAQYRLGLMLLEGRGVERSTERGLGLLARAAGQGHAAAASALASERHRLGATKE